MTYTSNNGETSDVDGKEDDDFDGRGVGLQRPGQSRRVGE